MFEFNEEDLKFNQGGQLSPSQKEWLKMVARGARNFSWTGAVVIIGFAALGLCMTLVLYLQNEDSRAALFSNPMNLLVFPVIVLVIVGIIVLSIALAYWNARKLENATLLAVTGDIRFDESYSSKSNIRSYYVFVGKKRFTFGDNMSRTFKEGGKYKVYYCKPGMYEFVMSFEKTEN
jgi:hypothetical protein